MESRLGVGRMKKFLVVLAVLMLCLSATGAHAAKNVILMIGDGMGFEHVKAGSYYLSGTAGNLCFEPYYKCSMTTHSLNSSITDSAAAATALATGYKTNNGVIGQSPSGVVYQSILEKAKSLYKRAGLVTTDAITGATPAGFGAHEPSRNNYINIGDDYLYGSQPELIFGGGNPALGSTYFNASQVTAAQGLGYQLAYNHQQMSALNPSGKALGLFASGRLTYEHDRAPSNTEPHLSQMTTFALNAMEQDPDGFFLMIEGANIDPAAHSNNIADVTFDVVEFHNAVQIVLNWMSGRNDTLLIVTADHETGGLTAINNGVGVIPGATWTSTSHTAAKVPLYATGPGSEYFDQYAAIGFCDNTNLFNAMVFDGTGPAGSILINSGAAYTDSTSVTLTLSATDADEMRFRNAGDSTWTDWQPYGTTKPWTLPTGDGVKSVEVQFRNTAGDLSPVYADSIVMDTEAPTGSIMINSGAAYATSTSVTLTLSGEDAGSGVSQMRFKNSGDSVWGSWLTYATSRAWTLPSGDGTKSVDVQFRDAMGRESMTYTDSIVLDQTAPTGSISINAGAAYTSSTSVTLTLSADDAASGVAEMALRNQGFAFGAWEPYVTTKPWTLTTGDGTKYVYVLFRDAAGHQSSQYSDSIILNTIPPTVTSITPSTGPNVGITSITDLAGTGFVSGATVKLQRTGQTDVTAANVSVVSSTAITCSLDLTGAGIGLWDVVVTNPSDLSGTLVNGFGITIDSGDTVGTSIRSLLDAVAVPGSAKHQFRVWGRVETIDSATLWLDDGSGARIRVFAPGYTDLETGEFASAAGTVDVSENPPVLVSQAAAVTEF